MSNIDWESVNDAIDFSDCVNNSIVEAKIVSVYDGDTVKAIFPLNGVMYKWNCRLGGVDTPELRTKSDIEKKHGYFVRDQLREKILNKVVTLECGDLDKYGRLLVNIKCDIDGNNCSVNNWLIEKDYAFEYDGGTKKSWEEYLIAKEKQAPKSGLLSVFGI
jgi:endonuclease YncB( thermonuclease family)